MVVAAYASIRRLASSQLMWSRPATVWTAAIPPSPMRRDRTLRGEVVVIVTTILPLKGPRVVIVTTRGQKLVRGKILDESDRSSH